MKAEHIETEATIALNRLRTRLCETYGDLSPRALHYDHVRPILEVLRKACNELDKGDTGKDAARTLLDLWQTLKIDAKDNSMSDLESVVTRMHEKAKSQDEW
jgi:hypothetical protein